MHNERLSREQLFLAESQKRSPRPERNTRDTGRNSLLQLWSRNRTEIYSS